MLRHQFVTVNYSTGLGNQIRQLLVDGNVWLCSLSLSGELQE